MPGLFDQIEEIPGSGIWVPSAVRVVNIVGSPVSSLDYAWFVPLLADDYLLEFSSVIPGVSGVLDVVPGSLNNPYAVTGLFVALDNSTTYDSVLPGLVLRFSDDPGFLSSWSCVVRCGRYTGSFRAFGPEAAVPGAPRKHRVTNTGADRAYGCKAVLRPVANFVDFRGRLFDGMRPFAVDSVEKSNDLGVVPYVVSTENVSGSGLSKVTDLLFDGAAVQVKNLSTDAESDSRGLGVVDWYEVVLGDLSSLKFLLDPGLDVSSESNVLVHSPRFLQLASGDASDDPGEFSHDDSPLTQVGQPEGEIDAGESAYYWERPLVDDGQNSRSNPHPCNVMLFGQAYDAAGWTLDPS